MTSLLGPSAIDTHHYALCMRLLICITVYKCVVLQLNRVKDVFLLLMS